METVEDIIDIWERKCEQHVQSLDMIELLDQIAEEMDRNINAKEYTTL